MTQTMMYGGPPPMPPMGPHRPTPGEPGWTIWSSGVWSATPLESAPRRVLAAALAAALIGGLFWRIDVLSVGYLIMAIAVFAAAFGTARRRPTATEAFGITLTLALLAVPAVRDSEWLGVLCICAAWVSGWLTLTGGRTWTSAAIGSFVAWLVPARVVRWVLRGLRRSDDGEGRHDARRIAVVVGSTVVLVLAFGALFAGADAEFADLVDRVVPTVDLPELPTQTFAYVIVLLFACSAAYLLRFRPKFDELAPEQGRAVKRWEWVLPMAVLDTLFVLFVAIQITVLFGGDHHVLTTSGLTYAEYARQGFWQLLAVSALTLLVLALALRIAPRASSADRTVVRVLVGVLCLASLVIVTSAAYRMWLYEQAYGFTALRLLVTTVEFWLGSIFVMICVAGIRMSARWLPRAVVSAGAISLLALAVVNPDRFIAEHNIERFEQSARIDIDYLSTLSADAVPALDRLPAGERACIFDQMKRRLAEPDAWYEYNYGRAAARHELSGEPTHRFGCDSTSGR